MLQILQIFVGVLFACIMFPYGSYEFGLPYENSVLSKDQVKPIHEKLEEIVTKDEGIIARIRGV